jgi:hypothetical protein
MRDPVCELLMVLSMKYYEIWVAVIASLRRMME